MKKLTFFAAIAMTAFLSTNALAQGDTESISGEATIVTPISLTVGSDLNFGTIAVSATTPGTAQFSTSGVLSATGGVTLPADGVITPTAATFTVNGQADYAYSITIPPTFLLTETVSGTATMSVALSEAATGVLTLGTETVTLGAVLTVPAAQQAGVYTGSFDVTVDYN